MAKFVNINTYRIKTSTITRYFPLGDNRISITHKFKEEFKFSNGAQRNEMLDVLDQATA